MWLLGDYDITVIVSFFDLRDLANFSLVNKSSFTVLKDHPLYSYLQKQVQGSVMLGLLQTPGATMYDVHCSIPYEISSRRNAEVLVNVLHFHQQKFSSAVTMLDSWPYQTLCRAFEFIASRRAYLTTFIGLLKMYKILICNLLVTTEAINYICIYGNVPAARALHDAGYNISYGKYSASIYEHINAGESLCHGGCCLHHHRQFVDYVSSFDDSIWQLQPYRDDYANSWYHEPRWPTIIDEVDEEGENDEWDYPEEESDLNDSDYDEYDV